MRDSRADARRRRPPRIKVGTPGAGRARTTAVVHYQRPAGDYDDWGLYAWGDIDPSCADHLAGRAAVRRRGRLRPLRLGQAQAGRQERRLPRGRPAAASRTSTPTGPSTRPAPAEIWLKQGDPAVTTSRRRPPASRIRRHGDASALPPADGDYAGWGLHVWDGAANPTEWAAPLQPAADRRFGVIFRVPLAAGATGLNYIIHNGDTKDLPDDQRLDFATAGREVWLLAGVPARLLPVVRKAGRRRSPTSPGRGRSLDRPRRPSPGRPATDRRSSSYDAGLAPRRRAAHRGRRAGRRRTPPSRSTAKRNGPHRGPARGVPAPVAVHRVRPRRADLATVQGALRGQLVVTERDPRASCSPPPACRSPACSTTCTPAATDATLGPTFRGGRPTLAVWAPTARTVALELFDTPAATARAVPMRRDDGHRRLVGTGRQGLDGHVLPVPGAGLAAGGAAGGHRVGHRPVLGGPGRRLHAQPARRPGRPGAGPGRLGRPAQAGGRTAPRRRRSGAVRPGLLHRRHAPCRPQQRGTYAGLHRPGNRPA